MGCSECVCCADPKESREPLKYDPEFRGPVKNRSCTDILFLVMFTIFTAGWIYVGYYAASTGDVQRILAPTDELGQKCGLDSLVQDKPYLVFFDIVQCLSPTTPLTGCPTPQVCVESCPSETIIFTQTNVEALSTNITNLRQKMVCRQGVDKNTITTSNEALLHIQQGQCAAYVLESQSVINRCIGDLTALACDRKALKSQRKAPFQRNKEVITSTTDGKSVSCLRNPNVASSKIMSKATALDTYIGMIIASWVAFFTKEQSEAHIMSNQIIEDMVQARWYLLGGLVVTIFICLIFIALMRWIVAPLVWISLIGLIALLGFLIYLCYKQYRLYLAQPVTLQVTTNIYGWAQSIFQDSTAWLVLLIFLAVVLAILLLMVVFLRKRIVIATALIKEGSKAVSSIKSTFAFPIFPWLLHCVAIVFGVVVIMFLMSIGESQFRVVGLNTTIDSTCVCANGYQNFAYCDPNVFNSQCRDSDTNLACRNATCHFVGIVSPNYITYLHLVNVAGFFWVIFFIQGLSEMMLASTFATWYWSLDKNNVPFFTLTAGCWRTIRYHMGTVAFGSLIITIVRLIRLVLEYIDHKLKKYDNAITKALLCCCKCLFLCLENFLKFINKNAYIMCAVHGKSFCSSARDAFSLLMRNILRVFVLDKVTDFVFFLSKLLVSLGVGVGVYYLLQWNAVYDLTGEERLNYNLVPAIILAMATYLIASLFFNVYAMAVDTLFLCFLEDCERNDGSPEKPYYMSKNLMKILHKKNK